MSRHQSKQQWDSPQGEVLTDLQYLDLCDDKKEHCSITITLQAQHHEGDAPAEEAESASGKLAFFRCRPLATKLRFLR
jgi:hypothetical protein